MGQIGRQHELARVLLDVLFGDQRIEGKHGSRSVGVFPRLRVGLVLSLSNSRHGKLRT